MDEFYLSVRIEPLAEGGYLATSNDLPGLVAQGRTVVETLEIAQDAARKLVESCIEHGDPLPRKIRAALKAAQRKAVVRIPIGLSPVAA
ncbi:MAG TPA: type II toxin-antitoxin system HicB family antitoxin [Verrucomicrobiota bacterium]|jgi:predicted RNase H-like HicB family nuclease|nr:type II toxin-antitoxin system HicB family antitoxin [Verrucomicrobiota bacterium]HQL77391.1 type II toxin-antitoxin system HicB family antitoxin [Verrucomicrobiota bacterium]